ncbi:hypothetical protein A21D_02941 [Virgibacillus dokdonensis]|uniref:DUF2953 domain-containing protein n=2 Tax=Virgibacillus dokdonensis TaxID=302167 RepID=A0A2K9J4L7_9BACI|nr:hypothetical protein A21D_02941 [Virgibacillus dokdonensis]
MKSVWITFWVLFILLITMIMICSINWKMSIRIEYSSTQFMLHIKISWLFIQIVNKTIQLQQLETYEERSFDSLSDQLQKMYRLLKEINAIAKATLQHIVIQQWQWYTKGGTGDAAVTGTLSGFVWGIKGVITSWIMGKSKQSCKSDLQVQPLFQQRYLEVYFSCMVSIKITQAITSFIQVLRIVDMQTKQS